MDFTSVYASLRCFKKFYKIYFFFILKKIELQTANVKISSYLCIGLVHAIRILYLSTFQKDITNLLLGSISLAPCENIKNIGNKHNITNKLQQKCPKHS